LAFLEGRDGDGPAVHRQDEVLEAEVVDGFSFLVGRVDLNEFQALRSVSYSSSTVKTAPAAG